MQTGEAQLKVMEALQEEAYKGIVRIDSGTMSHIGARPGDIVEIEGSRKTVAIVDRAYPSDVGQAVIRMDGIVRRNAKTGIGELVKVRAAEIKEAKSVNIAPAQKGVMIQAHPDVFKRGLLGRAVVKGDIVALGGTRRRRRTMSESPLFDDIFNVFGEDFMGNFGLSSLKFIITDTNPKDAIIITDSTEVKVSPKAVDVVEESYPEVNYEDIGGLDEEVVKIREMVELPLRHPEIFKKLGIEPPAGVLLHGPPGTGKTLLAKAVANESEANFILINGPEIMNKYYGESEKRLREVFEEAEKNSPSIIFIDEIDAIAPQREEVHGELERRVVAQLLALMDGLKNRGRVVVIAATNRPNAIDPALRRPGRFDREISFGVPDKKGRLNILKIHTRNMPLDEDVKLKDIADITHGFVGADLNALAKESAMSVLRRLLPEFRLREKDPIPDELLEKLVINAKDFQEALKIVRPSALREVLVEIPNIKWENVGGLDQTKDELKESVEWPLKYPSAFKRLGIKPPRGILLYGPPGTGKTLLAKAVANESQSNFILVKGPELLNKYVGESLPYDEELIIRKDGEIKRMKIGDIVEKKENVDVLTFDEDKRVVFSKIDDYIKHPLTSQLLEVTTKTGRKIRVTTDHSLFSFINGKFSSIPANYLVPKESYIAIPKRLNLPRERIDSINLYNYFNKDQSVFVGDIKDYLIRAKKILGLAKTAEILEVSKKYLAEIIGKNLPVSIIQFDKLIREAKLALNPEEIRIKLKGSRHSYPLLFKLDSDFWRLVGLWIAEGDFNGYTVRIHNRNSEIRKDAELTCQKYGFIISSGETCFSINSLLLQKIFKNVLKLPSGANNKRLPSMIYSLDKESKTNLLRGYFSGDGSIYKQEVGGTKIEASTTSKELANDILYLLLDFGIVATVYKKKERTGSITCRISILGVKNFEVFNKIGFVDNERNDKIKKYLDTVKWHRSELIPLSGELYEMVSQNVNVGNSIGKDRLKQVLIYVDKDKSKYKEYWDLVEGDIFFDLVKDIKILNNEKYVYDISVPDGQNFIAGFGGIFAHNSEKGVRKIFEKARQTSPTIVFFDEIDSIAPRRGTDSTKVTERIVNTMLSEIDGLEEMNDVIVIAASVTGDTPVLVKENGETKLVKIGEFIDKYYEENEENIEKPAGNIEVLGFEKINGKKIKGTRFKNSAFEKVRSVFRHKVNEIYEIEFLGGKIRTTGNHSVFVRTKKGVEFKPVSKLKEGEYLVDLPYKTQKNDKYKNLRMHNFEDKFDLTLPVYGFNTQLQQDYEFSLNSPLSQSQIGSQIGVVQTTVSNWRTNKCVPRGLSFDYYKHNLPNFVNVTPNLMRLFGYYVAEGYARKEIDFCFNKKEIKYVNDVQELMSKIFGLNPDRVREITKNAVNIIYHSRQLADFFIRYCGTGAENKQIPSFLFECPREYFLEFLKGYAAGDGHKNKKGGIEITSVSKNLIVELNWLCRMHGIKTSVSSFTAMAGRKIYNQIIKKPSLAYRLLIPKSNNPFLDNGNMKSLSKRAKIKAIRKLPYDGYVYDFCGCENEAFFGGETPILLHNTNRPDMIDPALLRPGRFDRTIMINVPDEKTRLSILKIHTKDMPLTSDVQLEKIAKDLKNFTGADIENLCRESAILALRENIKADKVTMKHFEDAMKKVRPSVNESDLDTYKRIEEEYLRTARGAAIKKEAPNYFG